MKTIQRASIIASGILAGAVTLTGCATSTSANGQPMRSETPIRKSPTNQKTVSSLTAIPNVPEGSTAVAVAYPAGDKSNGVLLLEMVGPGQTMVGAPYSYSLYVTNLRDDMQLRNVVVSDYLPEVLEYRSNTGNATRDKDVTGGPLMWEPGTLEPGETKSIKISGVATKQGEIQMCAMAEYDMLACITASAVLPQLVVEKEAPEAVLLCEDIPYTVRVRNAGTGVAKNVRLTDNLPEGLMTSEKSRTWSMNVGDLDAGQTKEYTFTTKASRTGEFNNDVTAVAEGNLTATDRTVTTVRQPVLTIDKLCPERDYINTSFSYDITVSNTGDAAAENTTITDRLPSNVEFVSASGGGINAAGVVTWNLGTLDAGKSRSLNVVVRGVEKGTTTNTVTAMAECAETVTDTCTTDLVGIPAILLEVIDLEDPVKVGFPTTYQIKVTNQGSETGTNVMIASQLEGLSFLSSDGPTQAAVTGQTVRFAPLATLEAGKSATWTIKALAQESGDMRFRTELRSDQIDRPVRETESTHLYRADELEGMGDKTTPGMSKKNPKVTPTPTKPGATPAAPKSMNK